MQFHLNGYDTGDPLVEDPHPSVAGRTSGLPEHADVLIVGCGPAGLVLAAQLARFPDLTTVIVDRRDGPLEVGQADGVACRTVEMFEAFGLADRLLREAYWVNETAFWRADADDPDRIVRTGRVQDVEEGLSEFPHVIVNQARMLAYLRDHMERSAARLTPFYGLHATGVEIPDDGPVTVTLQHVSAPEETSTIRARYVVGCDGSRSAIRTAIGRELVGDADGRALGRDGRPRRHRLPRHPGEVRRSPRRRATCSSSRARAATSSGVYLELDEIEDRGMLEDRGVTPERLATVANRILSPYEFEVKDVGWWSVYEIGQRLCDAFDDGPEGAPEGLHRRRRLPHAQREGRPGHERVHGRRLEPRVEARRRPAGACAAGAAAHVLHGTPGRRAGAHRLRPRVLQALQRAAAEAVTRRSSSGTSSRRAASPRGSRRATRRR